jgi:prepilin-type N-terminal cleavage/methylation domain-containing protein/prepilin-type processing-associated H-X9-DG protein
MTIVRPTCQKPLILGAMRPGFPERGVRPRFTKARSFHQPQSAFTLIELLAVIAITALLAALAFPALSKARKNGQAAACLSNMRQLGVGFMAYVAENNGFLPPVLTPYDGAPDMKTWDMLVTSDVTSATNGGYVPKVTVGVNSCKCPADTIAHFNNQPVRSYSMVWWVNRSNGWYVNPVRLVSIPNPSRKILLLEWHESINLRANNWDSCLEYGMWQAKSTGTLINNDLGRHHGKGANYLYLDGHAQWLSFEDAEKNMIYALTGDY